MWALGAGMLSLLSELSSAASAAHTLPLHFAISILHPVHEGPAIVVLFLCFHIFKWIPIVRGCEKIDTHLWLVHLLHSRSPKQLVISANAASNLYCHQSVSLIAHNVQHTFVIFWSLGRPSLCLLSVCLISRLEKMHSHPPWLTTRRIAGKETSFVPAVDTNASQTQIVLFPSQYNNLQYTDQKSWRNLTETYHPGLRWSHQYACVILNTSNTIGVKMCYIFPVCCLYENNAIELPVTILWRLWCYETQKWQFWPKGNMRSQLTQMWHICVVTSFLKKLKVFGQSPQSLCTLSQHWALFVGVTRYDLNTYTSTHTLFCVPFPQ